MLALFYISNKPAGMMSGEEDGQGITISFTSKIVHCVLADLCNHTSLEVSFHRVEMCKSMSPVFFLLLSRLNFVICQEEISSLSDAHSC